MKFKLLRHISDTKLKSGLKHRHSQAALYEKLLKGLPLVLPKEKKITLAHLFVCGFNYNKKLN